jgi:hypothetical protein
MVYFVTEKKDIVVVFVFLGQQLVMMELVALLILVTKKQSIY